MKYRKPRPAFDANATIYGDYNDWADYGYSDDIVEKLKSLYVKHCLLTDSKIKKPYEFLSILAYVRYIDNECLRLGLQLHLKGRMS